MMRVLVVFGTRPEAVKLAPVIRELGVRGREAGIDTLVCVSSQHREMLDQTLGLFKIVPDFDLDTMRPNQTPAETAARVLARLDRVLAQVRPDWLVVQGDTTTVAAASLGAHYQRVQVAHVEAGLRTHDRWQPFPEETNRRVVGAIADLHFAPTEGARANLLREGVPAGRVIVTGNPVIDALDWVVSELGTDAGDASGLEPEGRLILVTAHRRENFGSALESICLALLELAERYGAGVRIVYPVHLNPNVQERVRRVLGAAPNITLLPPLDYRGLVAMLTRAHLVLTDSGGLQEEAPALGKPVLVLREVTERPEAVEAGVVRVVGTERSRIVAEAARLLDDPGAYHRMARIVRPYGDGRASARIVAALLGRPVEPFRPTGESSAPE